MPFSTLGITKNNQVGFTMNNLESILQDIYEGKRKCDQKEFQEVFEELIKELNAGRIRAAQPVKGKWQVNEWVKKGILLGFKFGELKDYSINSSFSYFDKHTFKLRPVYISDRIRIVPGGTSIRTGSHVASDVVIMPPAYINVGAYVGAKTMVDSHTLVGSCAQIGSRVHLSAGAQIGGVLEPIGALPVIIEDDVLVGGNCGVYEGTIVKSGAVLGAGTILTASIPVYDIVKQRIIRKSEKNPLVIPENAVVVPGSRPIRKSTFAIENKLQYNCAIIIKYRDEGTEAVTTLEETLR